MFWIFLEFQGVAGSYEGSLGIPKKIFLGTTTDCLGIIRNSLGIPSSGTARQPEVAGLLGARLAERAGQLATLKLASARRSYESSSHASSPKKGSLGTQDFVRILGKRLDLF